MAAQFDPMAHLDATDDAPRARAFDPMSYLDQASTDSQQPRSETIDPKADQYFTRGGDISPGHVIAEKLVEGVTAPFYRAVGGLKGLWDLARGKSLNEVADDIERTRMPTDYGQIRSAGAGLAEEVMNQPANPLNWPGQAIHGYGLIAQQFGASPNITDPAEQAAGNVLPFAIGLRGAPKLRETINDNMARAEATPEVVPPGTRPVIANDLQSRLSQQYAGQSMGAAAATPNLLNATPQLRTKVQEALDSGQPLTEANKTALVRHVEAESLPIPAKLTRGQALGDETIKSDEFNAKSKKEISQRFEEQNQNLIDNLQAIREQVGPEVFSTDLPAHGDTLINAYRTKDAAVKADISAKYQALKDANGGEFPVDGQAFAENARQALKDDMKEPFLPPAIGRLVSQYADGEPMTFKNFENMRTILAAEARKAARAGDGNAEHAISLVRNSLEDLPMGEGSVQLKMLADQARTAARQRFEAIEADPAYKAAVNDSVVPDKFVQRFIIGGSRDGVALMRSNLSHDPVAQQTMGVSLMDYLREQSGAVKGQFRQEGYNKAMRGLAPKINSLVDRNAAEQLERLGNVAQWEMQQGRGGYYNNSGTWISAAKEWAGNTAEGVANVKSGGIPVGSIIRNRMKANQDKRFLQSTLEPGAGISDPK